MTPSQGEIWLAEVADWGSRPVLVLTRDQAIPLLRTIVIAPVTRTVRGIPTELPLGPDDGLDVPCAASFDNLQVVPKAALRHRLGRSSVGRHHAICDRLRAFADC